MQLALLSYLLTQRFVQFKQPFIQLRNVLPLFLLLLLQLVYFLNNVPTLVEVIALGVSLVAQVVVITALGLVLFC
jgi:hypothetical protein